MKGKMGNRQTTDHTRSRVNRPANQYKGRHETEIEARVSSTSRLLLPSGPGDSAPVSYGSVVVAGGGDTSCKDSWFVLLLEPRMEEEARACGGIFSSLSVSVSLSLIHE